MIKLTTEQEQIKNEMLEKKHVILKLGVGFGKTYTSLFASRGRTLIICQSEEIKKQWKESIDNLPFVLDYFLTTYHKIGKIVPEKFETLIVDEGQNFINHKSNRVKQLKNIVKNIKYKYILTATPIRKNESDIFRLITHFKLKNDLILNYPTLNNFYLHFFKWREEYDFFRNDLVNKPYEFKEEHREEFNNSIGLIEKKQDKFEFYHKVVNFKKIDMVDYNWTKKHGVVSLENFEEVVGAGNKVNALYQITNSVHTSQKEPIDQDYLIKFEAIGKILAYHKKIMLVYAFKNQLELLKKHFKSTEKVEEFEKGDFPVFARQIQRDSGLNVPFCDTMVFLSINYSAINFMQMKGRIERQNSKFNKLYYYYLCFENTIEKDIYDVVEKRVTKNELLKKYEKNEV